MGIDVLRPHHTCTQPRPRRPCDVSVKVKARGQVRCDAHVCDRAMVKQDCRATKARPIDTCKTGPRLRDRRQDSRRVCFLAARRGHVVPHGRQVARVARGRVGERRTTVRGRAPRCRTLVKAHANNSSAHCGAEGPPRQTVWKGIDRMRCTGQGPGQGRVNEHNTQAQASHHSWRAYLTSVGRGQAVVHPHTKKLSSDASCSPGLHVPAVPPTLHAPPAADTPHT